MGAYRWAGAAAAVEDARQQQRLSIRAAASLAGVSEGWWRQFVRGTRRVGRGAQAVHVPIDPNPAYVRAAIRAVGLDPAPLIGDGDSASEDPVTPAIERRLRRIERRLDEVEASNRELLNVIRKAVGDR